MSSIIKIRIKMNSQPTNVSFKELFRVCEHYFGDARQLGTSHCVFKTPWPGDPRINIQCGEKGKAKVYQVKQVLIAIEKLESLNE
jgi:hypothetical protein